VNVKENSLSIIDLDQHKTLKVPVGEHPYCVASSDGKLVYVTNTQGDSVSVVDTDKMKTIQTIPVGGFPEGINYDKASRKVYVANWFDNSVSVIDGLTNKLVASIPTGTQSRAFGQFVVEVAH
jgi:YVTN family beta-propeller protein